MQVHSHALIVVTFDLHYECDLHQNMMPLADVAKVPLFKIREIQEL